MLLFMALLGLWGGAFWLNKAPAKESVPPVAQENGLVTLQQSALPETEVLLSNRKYRLEVTSTPQQAEVGLMYRTYLPKDHGMLFTFPEVKPVAFWMKNTKIPLDMLFIRAGKVVHITHQAAPCQSEPCPIYPSGFPVDMVIELPGGTAKQDQLQVGTKVQLLSVASRAPSSSSNKVLPQK